MRTKRQTSKKIIRIRNREFISSLQNQEQLEAGVHMLSDTESYNKHLLDRGSFIPFREPSSESYGIENYGR